MRSGTDDVDEDDDPEVAIPKKKERALDKQIADIERRERIADKERHLAAPMAKKEVGDSGKKRPVREVVPVHKSKKKLRIESSRVSRSTESTDAVKLEVLREMHELYLSMVENECVLPTLKNLSKELRQREKMDSRRELKGKLRRSSNARVLFLDKVQEFLRESKEKICDRFKFPGTPDNVLNFIHRVAQNESLPEFVWKHAELKACGRPECVYCE